MNAAIKVYNNSIGTAVGLLSGKKIDITIEEINPDMSLEDIQKSGAGTFGLGVIDQAVKFVRRQGIPILQGINFMGLGGPQAAIIVSGALAILEGAVDHTKDLMLGNALGSLAAEVGDLKDGQTKLNSKINAQGKAQTEALNKLSGKLSQTKSELEGKLAGQGSAIGQLQSQTSRLDSSLNKLSQAHSEFKAETQAQFEEVNERLDTTEVKITKNARDILEEKLEREAIDNELRDKIKENKLHLNNLQETQEELREDFQSYQNKTDRQLDQINQEIENTQEEFHQQLKIQETKIQLEIEQTKDEFEQANNLINTKIHHTQEILEEYEEEVNNIHHQQQRLNTEFQELTDDVETQFDLIHQQQRKLNLVADQMAEITEETNRRMDKFENSILDIEEQAEEAMNIARKATRQVNQLTEDLQKERKRINHLNEQITQNRQDTKEAKKEAQRANERIDNLLKRQQLSDFTQEQLAFAKLQKTLQLKADEAKLLAQLNILNQTQKLLPEEEPEERE
jgi:chromosome segregation ATPase